MTRGRIETAEKMRLPGRFGAQREPRQWHRNKRCRDRNRAGQHGGIDDQIERAAPEDEPQHAVVRLGSRDR